MGASERRGPEPASDRVIGRSSGRSSGRPSGRSHAPTPGLSLKARAIQLLSQREHSRVELQRKLLPHAVAEELLARGPGADTDQDPRSRDNGAAVQARVDALLDWLEAHRHLSQQRFVETRVHARASRFGNLRIRQELAQHQLVLPDEVAASLRDSELERARAVWSNRFSARPTDPAGRGRQARFLAGRGFSSEVIHRVLREAGQAEAREDDHDKASDSDSNDQNDGDATRGAD